MTTVVAGWVVVLSEAQQAQLEGCKMINTRREGLSQRQGYPRLYSDVRVDMKGKATNTEGKIIHTQAHAFMPINDWCQICSQDSWVMCFPVDQWEETQIWVRPVEGEWLTAETAARLPTAGLRVLRPRSLSLSLPCHVWRKKKKRTSVIPLSWRTASTKVLMTRLRGNAFAEWTYITEIHEQFKSEGGERHIYFFFYWGDLKVWINATIKVKSAIWFEMLCVLAESSGGYEVPLEYSMHSLSWSESNGSLANNKWGNTAWELIVVREGPT